jgi:hypothetical protein
MRDSIVAVATAKQAMADKNLKVAEEALNKASSLWAQNNDLIAAKANLAAMKPQEVKPAALTAAKARPKAEEKPVVEQQAVEKAPKPFYMRPMGALAILGGLLVVVAIGSVINKAWQKRAVNRSEQE